MSKILMWVGICLVLLSAFFGQLGWDYYYAKQYGYALKLADDASLPEQKAEYLREYLECVKTIKGQPRYFLITPDLELTKQVKILEGLVRRFEDIAKLSPSEMAYQQGMAQMTDQEVDHQKSRIAKIFKDAKYRENIFVFVLLTWGWLMGILLYCLGWFIK